MENQLVRNEVMEEKVVQTPDMYPEHQYEAFERGVKAFFEKYTQGENGKVNLFMTDVEDLNSIYLDNIEESARQHYTCNACKRFINTYGSLVVIKEDGTLMSVLWDPETTPSFFKKSVEAMKRAVEKANIVKIPIFPRTNSGLLGIPKTGEWSHLHVSITKEYMYYNYLKSAYEREAELKEEFGMLSRGLEEFNYNTAKTALSLVQSDSICRSEKVLGPAQFFMKIHERLNGEKNTKIKNNIIWSAVASAPTGFCHIKSTMIGTLLEDIQSGLSFEEVKSIFEDKIDPTKYMRQQRDAKEQEIKRANEIFSKLGIESALERRFARLDEIKTIWRTEEKKEESTQSDNKGGVFDSLLDEVKKDKSSNNRMTVNKEIRWKVFERDILPKVKELYLYNISSRRRYNFTAILTQNDPNAKPILSYDKEEQRNPFSQYVYHNGSFPVQWGIDSGKVKVMAICDEPALWYSNGESDNRFTHEAVFILENCRDSLYKDNNGNGNALFPELLRSELHEIRKTVEMYSNRATIHGYDESSACGIAYHARSNKIQLFTTIDGVDYIYTITDWE